MNKPLSALLIAGKLSLAALIVFALMIVAIIPILVIVNSAQSNPSINDIAVSELFNRLTMIAQTLCFIGAVLIMYAVFERKTRWLLGWRQDRSLKALAEGALWGIVFMSAAFAIIWLVGGLEFLSMQFDADSVKSFGYAVFLFALVAISEELVSRGYIQGLVRRSFGVTPAILVTSLIFAALHLLNANVLQNPIPVINLFLAGVLLGVAREASGGLWMPIGIHFTWNLFQGNVFGFAVSGNGFGESFVNIMATGSTLISGGAFGAEGSLVVTALTLGLTLLLWQRRKRDASGLPDSTDSTASAGSEAAQGTRESQASQDAPTSQASQQTQQSQQSQQSQQPQQSQQSQ